MNFREYVSQGFLKGELERPPIEDELYVKIHEECVIACVDVFIAYKEGILLVKRGNQPAKDEFWPVGGRLPKGLPVAKAIEKKAFEECGLQVEDVVFLGVGRTAFDEDPFKHSKGSDTLNLVYFARGRGEIRLDKLHEKHTIVAPSDSLELFSPYVRDFLSKSFKILSS